MTRTITFVITCETDATDDQLWEMLSAAMVQIHEPETSGDPEATVDKVSCSWMTMLPNGLGDPPMDADERWYAMNDGWVE